MKPFTFVLSIITIAIILVFYIVVYEVTTGLLNVFSILSLGHP